MRNLVLGAALVGVSLAGGAVAAGEGPWYVGAELGVGMNSDFVSADNDGSLSGIDKDESDTTYRVFGGYRFNPYVGVEGGYTDLGESGFDATSSGGPSWDPGMVSTRFEADGWALGVRGAYPVGERWTLFASVDAFRWKTTETFMEETIGTTVDENEGTDVRYGVGAEYDVGKKGDWVLRGDVDRAKVDDDGDNVDSVTAGALYRF